MKKKRIQKFGLYDSLWNEAVYRSVDKNMSCLDVGCWTGNLGAKLIQLKHCQVEGIDERNGVLEYAKSRGFTQVYKVDLDSMFNLPGRKGFYDCIICADVLEHLKQPVHVLQNLRNYLKNSGQIIISVPNIAFALQRLLLLFGRFEYSDGGGIMDSGHLRFFTESSLRKMCVSAGYEVVSVEGVCQVRKRYFFLRILGKIYPELFAIQLLAKLKKA